MSTKSGNETPPSVEETLDLFFGETDQKEINLTHGRPKLSKKEIETKKKEKKKNKRQEKKEQSEREALIQKLKFFKQFNKQIQDRTNLELYQKTERAKQRIKKKERKEKKELRKEKLEQLQKSLQKPQSVDSKTCDHTLIINYISGNIVSTVCSKCSVSKQLTMKEWLIYNAAQNNTSPPTENPNRLIFPI